MAVGRPAQSDGQDSVTDEGLDAISDCLAEGIGVNAHLLVSAERYGQAADACLDGLERAAAAGRDLASIGSVASFLISRVDTAIDELLEHEGLPEAKAMRGTAAIANAMLAHEHHDHAFSGPRWHELARRGARPQRLVWVNGRRFRANIMSAVASRGALWFTVFPGKFTAKVFCTFLDRLARQARRKVHVVVDRHPVHRSKAVRTWLDENAERIELHLMPGYSPELNPDELLNADLKHHVHAARATSIDDLARETRRFLHRRQRQPHIVCGYFGARHVRYSMQ